MSPLAVIAAGGTGGHMFPAQALAEALLARGWRVALSTDARGLRYAGGFPAAVERVGFRAESPARGGPLALVALARGAWAARGWMRGARPAVVAGFGGYPAFPALAAAWMLGLPRLIHEANGVLGRVNRLFAARVHAVACPPGGLARAPAGARLVETGNPVRPAVLAARAPYAPPEGETRLVIFGGSQGASALSRLVPPALAALPDRRRLRVAMQAREAEADAVRATLDEAGITAEVRPFFDDMPQRLAAAHLVVARSGASTVAELCAMGRPALLIPFPAAMDDHQSANAAAMAAAGAAEVHAEAALTPAALSGHLARLLADPRGLSAMAAAALTLSQPDAAQRLADLVETLSRGRSPG